MKKTALWMILVAMLISGVSIASAASIKLGIPFKVDKHK